MSSEKKYDQDKFNAMIQKIERYDRFRRSRYSIEKTTNWIFAISAGTFLWLMGSFDKFVISNTMPNKVLYLTAVLFLGVSTVLFFLGKGILYMRQIVIDNTIESIEGLPDRAKLNRLHKTEEELDLMVERILNKKLESWGQWHNTITSTVTLIKYGLLFYIIGLVMLSTYIIIFIVKYF